MFCNIFTERKTAFFFRAARSFGFIPPRDKVFCTMYGTAFHRANPGKVFAKAYRWRGEYFKPCWRVRNDYWCIALIKKEFLDKITLTR